jgi:ubiquinone/menaquinone biosynthesis C-methylase UbiE
MSARPDYGIDSPAIVIGLFVVSAGAFALALLFGIPGHRHQLLQIASIVGGAYFLLAAGGMVWYSKAGKLRIRDSVLNTIPWRGDELVLDVGCGRGLLLSGAAHRLRSGKAIGIDLWVPGALTGNVPQSAARNAQLEGVIDRVELIKGDVRCLPFASDCFDVAVSNFVLHEVDSRAEREQMLKEMVRVIKPGGRVALVDFIFTRECIETFPKFGISNLSRQRAGSFFSFWFSAVINFGLVQTCQVTGRKPVIEQNQG